MKHYMRKLYDAYGKNASTRENGLTFLYAPDRTLYVVKTTSCAASNSGSVVLPPP